MLPYGVIPAKAGTQGIVVISQFLGPRLVLRALRDDAREVFCPASPDQWIIYRHFSDKHSFLDLLTPDIFKKR